MSAVTHDHPLPGAVARHLSAEEYQADLRARGIRDLRQALRRRRAFVERYSLLVAWLAAPLPERVGHVLGEPLERMTCRVAYDARSYLYFLVRRGCLRLDYAWLLAIQRTKVCGVLAGTPLTAGLDRLRDEAIGLGYDATRVDDPLRWAVGRLFLHTGKGDVEALTLADIEELRAAIVAFGARADLTAYYQSATTWDFVRREALGSLHVLWVVLYHRGQVTEEPRWHRRPAAPPPPPSPPLLTACAGSRRHPSRCVAAQGGHAARRSSWYSPPSTGMATMGAVARGGGAGPLGTACPSPWCGRAVLK